VADDSDTSTFPNGASAHLACTLLSCVLGSVYDHMHLSIIKAASLHTRKQRMKQRQLMCAVVSHFDDMFL